MYTVHTVPWSRRTVSLCEDCSPGVESGNIVAGCSALRRG
jgi:hypothetical protein